MNETKETFQERMERKVIESVYDYSARLDEFKEIFPTDWTQSEIDEFILAMFTKGLLKATGPGKYTRNAALNA